jgi:vacuolar-type H+-ATPase subunit I/STV1
MYSKWSKEDAKVVREMIFKEVEFINHRLTWLVTLQGLLFAALSFAWEEAQELINLLGTIGIVVSMTSCVGLWLARQAIRKLRSEWETNRPKDYVGPDVVGYFSQNKVVEFCLPWFVLPVLFIVVWALVLVMHCN